VTPADLPDSFLLFGVSVNMDVHEISWIEDGLGGRQAWCDYDATRPTTSSLSSFAAPGNTVSCPAGYFVSEIKDTYISSTWEDKLISDVQGFNCDAPAGTAATYDQCYTYPVNFVATQASLGYTVGVTPGEF